MIFSFEQMVECPICLTVYYHHSWLLGFVSVSESSQITDKIGFFFHLFLKHEQYAVSEVAPSLHPIPDPQSPRKQRILSLLPHLSYDLTCGVIDRGITRRHLGGKVGSFVSTRSWHVSLLDLVSQYPSILKFLEYFAFWGVNNHLFNSISNIRNGELRSSPVLGSFKLSYWTKWLKAQWFCILKLVSILSTWVGHASEGDITLKSDVFTNVNSSYHQGPLSWKFLDVHIHF